MAEQPRPEQQNNAGDESSRLQEQTGPASAQQDVQPAEEEGAVIKNTPTSSEGTPEQNGVVQRLRTYRDDVARAMKQKGTSQTSIATAEATRRRTKQPNDDSPKKKRGAIIKIVVSVFLVVLGIGVVGGGAYYVMTRDAVPQQEELAVPSFFFVDGEKELNTSNLDENELRAAMDAAIQRISLSLGSIGQVYLTRTIPSQSPETGPQKTLVGSADFFSVIGAEVPSSFPRALAGDFMFGGHVFDGTQPFLVFRVNSYEQAFAGMLEWEDSMSRDLEPIFGPEVTPATVGTSTVLRQRPFRDEVVRNQDVRVLRDESGEPAIMYLFPNRQTLLITTNENTMAEVLTRLSNARR